MADMVAGGSCGAADNWCVPTRGKATAQGLNWGTAGNRGQAAKARGRQGGRNRRGPGPVGCPGPAGPPAARPRCQGRRVAMARPRPAPRSAPLASQHGGGGRCGAAGAAPAAAAGGGGGAAVPAGGGPADRAGGRLGAPGAAQLLGRLGGAVLQLVLRPLHRLRPHLAGAGGGRQR